MFLISSNPCARGAALEEKRRGEERRGEKSPKVEVKACREISEDVDVDSGLPQKYRSESGTHARHTV